MRAGGRAGTSDREGQQAAVGIDQESFRTVGGKAQYDFDPTMGNCAYRLSLHAKRAPATGRICAGGDTTGWNEPLRVGFWSGPSDGREANHAAKKEELTEVRHAAAEFCDFDVEIRGSLVFTIWGSEKVM